MMGGRRRHLAAGVSLVEVVVAIGVLALVIPLALMAMVKAGEEGNAARAETRTPAIAEICLSELEAARGGNSEFFERLEGGRSFPGAGEVMGLAFGRGGKVLGKISQADFDAGLLELGGEDVFYLATMEGEVDDGDEALLTVTVRVEYPATLKSKRRRGVSLHTKLP